MFWRLVLRSLWGRRSRLAMALLAVALGVTVAIALGTLSLQVGDELARTLRAAGPNLLVRPAGSAWGDVEEGFPQPALAGAVLPESSLPELKRTFWRNNLLAAAPEIATSTRAAGTTFHLVGTYFDRWVPLEVGDGWRTGLAALHPTWKVRGRWPSEDASDQVVLGGELAVHLGLHPGDTLVLEAQPRPVRWMVTGIVDCGGVEERWAWAPLEAVRSLARRPPGFERIWVSALLVPLGRKPPPHPERDPVAYERYMCTAYPQVVARDLSSAIAGSEALPLGEIVAAEARVVGRLNFMMLLLALAALAASALGLASTTFAAVVERKEEIGLLRALGAAPGQVAALLLGETLAISVAGGACGFALGSLAARWIGSMGVGAMVQPKLALLPVAVLLSIGVGLAATWFPLRLASRVDPVEALRG